MGRHSFFTHLNDWFPYRQLPSVFGRHAKKAVILCFHFQIVKKLFTNQMATVIMQNNSRFLGKTIKEGSVRSCKDKRKSCCEEKLLHSPPRCEDVLSTYIQTFINYKGKHTHVVREIGHFLIHLPLCGLSIQSFQVTDLWQKFCQ